MEIKPLETEVSSKLRSSSLINNVAQCVYELVCNSLDAKSTSIAVRINLLTFKIQVADNGEGITKENMELIGPRYSTNKCHTLSDLKHLKTYGFKGEALASISEFSASVSIQSRTKYSNETYSKVLAKGKTNEVTLVKTRPSVGTTVTVTGWLNNIPVRQRRLIPQVELEEVKKTLESLLLVNLKTSFTLRNDITGLLIVNSPKHDNVLSAFRHLHSEINDSFSLFKVTKGTVSIELFINKDICLSRQLHYIYVNKRPVKSGRIEKIIERLSNKWGIKKYPVYIIRLKCPEIYVCTFQNEVDFTCWNLIETCLNKLEIGNDIFKEPVEAQEGKDFESKPLKWNRTVQGQAFKRKFHDVVDNFESRHLQTQTASANYAIEHSEIDIKSPLRAKFEVSKKINELPINIESAHISDLKADESYGKNLIMNIFLMSIQVFQHNREPKESSDKSLSPKTVKESNFSFETVPNIINGIDASMPVNVNIKEKVTKEKENIFQTNHKELEKQKIFQTELSSMLDDVIISKELPLTKECNQREDYIRPMEILQKPIDQENNNNVFSHKKRKLIGVPQETDNTEPKLFFRGIKKTLDSSASICFVDAQSLENKHEPIEFALKPTKVEKSQVPVNAKAQCSYLGDLDNKTDLILVKRNSRLSSSKTDCRHFIYNFSANSPLIDDRKKNISNIFENEAQCDFDFVEKNQKEYQVRKSDLNRIVIDSQNEWHRCFNENNKKFFFNPRTGMVNINTPTLPLDYFGFEERLDFIPKGLSPVLKGHEEVDRVLSQNARGKLQNLILEGYDDDAMLKWRNCFSKDRDVTLSELKLFFEEVYRNKTKMFDSNIPKIQSNVLFSNSITFSAKSFENIRVIGQVDKKFIAALDKSINLLLLFDQHAVHERILVEKLSKALRGVKTVYEPNLTIFMPHNDLSLLQIHSTYLETVGLNMKYFTDGLHVTHIPLCLKEKCISENSQSQLNGLIGDLIREVLDFLKATSGSTAEAVLPNIIRTIINSKACRGAVKFGEDLSIEQCQNLLFEVSKCQLPFQCAHGRRTLTPVVSLDEIKFLECTLEKRKPNFQKLLPKNY
ncbi:hypothetical protein ABEB36_007109 [Hypothenemus hampei]|uniref:MutL C-terminal dimerisation domain-containing protein n=1 Tax=Hypothenemus hampei TaxID=57062 RepID=A0ABD1ESY3_HYPHA